jgi:type III secretion protein U
MIGVEGGWLVGVRYVRGETPVPVVVCSAEPTLARGLFDQSAKLGIPRSADNALATRIGRLAKPGEPIPANAFQLVADALVAARLI